MIVGMPRSGTSWLGALFDSHPRTIYLHEPDTIDPGPELPRLFPDNDWSEYSSVAYDYIVRIAKQRGLRAVYKHPFFAKDYRSEAARLGRGALVASLRALNRSSRRLSKRMRQWQIPDLGRTSTSQLTVFKSVEALGRLPAIANGMSEMRVIHLIRHPAGFVSSQLRGREMGKFTNDTFLPKQFSLEPARRRGMSGADAAKLPDVERLAWSWMVMNEWALETTRSMPNVRTVIYDDVAANPLDQMRTLFRWAGLDWPLSTERFLVANLAAHHDASGFYSVDRNPAASANGWRGHLSPDVIERIRGVVSGSLPAEFFSDLDHDPVPSEIRVKSYE